MCSTVEKTRKASTKNVRIPKWLKTREYSALVHPWSVVYVEFFPSRMPEKYHHYYAVDEKEFLEQMKAWNVELEEC